MEGDDGGKGGRVLLGDARGWEYGVPDTVGWIDTIGVHPVYQKKGIGGVLLMEMVDNVHKVGVNTILHLAMGFQRGNMINLELKI